MSIVEAGVLLFIVVDPFGNIPFVLAVLQSADAGKYRKAIAREIGFATLVLALFVLAGREIIEFLNIEQSSLSVAGGVILFIISLQLIFRSPQHIFTDEYADDPWFVPIAIPSIAGPSAIATLMLIRSKSLLPLLDTLVALSAVMVLTLLIFLAARQLARVLGGRGLRAMNRLMGMLLNIIAVNMIMEGVARFLAVNGGA